MPRVYEVAREMGMSSQELIGLLEDLGHPVRSHASSVDDSVVAELKENHQGPAAVPAARPGDSEKAADVTGEPPRTPSARRRARVRSVLKHLAELPVLMAFALVIAVVVKTFLVQAFFIPSGSMQPTLRIGDRVLVEKLGYRLSDPGRGHVVVFERAGLGSPDDFPLVERVRTFLRELVGLPTGFKEDYIKRVVAVEGESVRYQGRPRVLYVNGSPVEEPYLTGTDRNSPTLTPRDCRRLSMPRTEDGCRVPAGRLFVMGDNRGNSEDSRALGPISKSRVVGRAFSVIWPAIHIRRL